MSRLRAFWASVSNTVAAPQQYATGLVVPEDDLPAREGLALPDEYASDKPGREGLALPEEYATDKPAREGLALPDEYAGDEELEERRRQRGPLGLSASVGRGGKNEPDDVLAVQKALNKRVNAGVPETGKCDAQTIQAIEEFQMRLGQFKPSGRIYPGRGPAGALAGSWKLPPPPEPPKPIAPPKLGKPTLTTAPKVWHGTRDILGTNIQELKKGILAHYGTEHPDVLKEIDEQLKKLGVILEKLDHRLADSLDEANAADDDDARAAELKNAKSILTDYIKYVKSESLIEHVDSNPFGVDTKLKLVLLDALAHMAKSIG